MARGTAGSYKQPEFLSYPGIPNKRTSMVIQAGLGFTARIIICNSLQ